MTITAAQARGGRAMAGMTQDELADAAKITRKTLATFETGQSRPHAPTIAKVQRVLEASGIVFFDSDEGRGVMLKGDKLEV